MKQFKLPDLGEGLQEAEIVEWHVTAGEAVEVDQLLVSVETAKAIVEVPSPRAGVVSRCFGAPGDLLHVGEPLVEFEGEGEDSGTVVGDLGRASGSSDLAADDFIIGAASSSREAQPQAVMPAARKLAEREGVELAQLKGNGPGGLVTTADVQQAADALPTTGEALRSVRRTMARNMARAHAEVAPVTIVEDADLYQWAAGARDPMVRLARAIARACAAQPALNVAFDGKRLSVRQHDNVDLGVAVDTPDGLFVPVLRDVANREAEDLREGLAQLRADVSNRSIPPRELMGATITLSNYGTLFGRYASPVIMPPQVAIIGAGVIRDQVVAHQGQVVVHPILPLSLTVDHRAVTGGEAARFLKVLVEDLQTAE
ncbi:pyruvate dehydrogenase E2 component (dihydrolipoamide acetyltransferase) [Halopseudomonas litoralis]|uniref:Dihydrolipoamide acetyltransferase component of pyruvate dehydrogenase complex n=1 Tax=Halopseudomonas litoralis TaxID=797277 RepID=A0A1H1WHC9_9GAMM|nr:dihydrolipoamide acetyltransferase family protein [Halopseudomonas litoralis]SDS96031.1 pyruvate dehydrogenase E2 component (dihydrolipoamide acetyltransferase) [Halopseudomonas litoralis]